jgi:putative transposase
LASLPANVWHFNGLHKAELTRHHAPWKTKGSLALITFDWISWFNHQRLWVPIWNIALAEAKANCYRKFAKKIVTPVSL